MNSLRLTEKFFDNKNSFNFYDNLTKVYNRETIISYINYLIENNCPFSLAVIDIDNFKHINDDYGHLIGDKVLIKMSQIYIELSKKIGVVGRYGGDEFLIVFENFVEYKDVWNVFHKLNNELCLEVFHEINNITVSVTSGICRYPMDGISFDELFNHADKALYRGKEKGRNCFIIYDEAKHGKINVGKSLSYTDVIGFSTTLLEHLSNFNKNLNLTELFKFLETSYNFDHLCVQSKNKLYFEFFSERAKFIKYRPMSEDTINSLLVNGNFKITDYRTLNLIGKTKELEELDSSNIHACMVTKIKAYGKSFGYLRCEMINTRMWQNSDIIAFTWIARIIGLILSERNLEIKDLK